MHIKYILRNLKLLKYDIRTLMTSFGEKVVCLANITGLYCLYSNLKGMLHFSYGVMKIKIYFFPSSYTTATNSDPRAGYQL